MLNFNDQYADQLLENFNDFDSGLFISINKPILRRICKNLKFKKLFLVDSLDKEEAAYFKQMYNSPSICLINKKQKYVISQFEDYQLDWIFLENSDIDYKIWMKKVKQGGYIYGCTNIPFNMGEIDLKIFGNYWFFQKTQKVSEFLDGYN